MKVSKIVAVAQQGRFLCDYLSAGSGEEEEDGSRWIRVGIAQGIGTGSLTTRCHLFVSGDGALERPPFTPELIRGPPVPARVRKLAPDYLALVENGDRRDSGWCLMLFLLAFPDNSFRVARGPFVCWTFREGQLTCA